MKNRKKTSRVVVKRRGRTEPYDERKVYASVYAAALNCHYDERLSEEIALEAMKKVNTWARGKTQLLSQEIREHVLSVLEDRHVALMYRHHTDLC
jgi:transcriptional regulator NrdR family protein